MLDLLHFTFSKICHCGFIPQSVETTIWIASLSLAMTYKGDCFAAYGGSQ
ncbi:MAG: hypothetical protein FWD66_00160 [Paludibacter sp.]|nr:hypothetical protein [Paludibacter sp.]